MESSQLAFWTACSEGDGELARQLLARPGVDINWRHPDLHRRTALYAACRRRALATATWLLAQPHLDPNIPCDHGETPLYVACANDMEELVAVLVRDPRVALGQANLRQVTPLWIACHEGCDQVVKLLLAAAGTGHRNLHLPAHPTHMLWSQDFRTPRVTCLSAAEVADLFWLRCGHIRYRRAARLVKEFEGNPAAVSRRLRRELGAALFLEFSPFSARPR